MTFFHGAYKLSDGVYVIRVLGTYMLGRGDETVTESTRAGDFVVTCDALVCCVQLASDVDNLRCASARRDLRLLSLHGRGVSRRVIDRKSRDGRVRTW